MNKTVAKLLSGMAGDHILPFFWQHGEEEAVLRGYMRAIHESGCGSVCVESRPHPDFCGPKWWADLDVIFDEARKRDMKIWILDDAHFPTGYANGAVENAPAELCRQSICASRLELSGERQAVDVELAGLIPPPFTPNMMESYILPRMPKPRKYDGDTIMHVSAFCPDTKENADLTPYIRNGALHWEKPSGRWTVWVCGLSRNCGPHRNYINMLDKESCRLLIDAVYEPHWERYGAEFGRVLAGFFSDEPELGNGHLYDMESYLGTDNDLPFGREMPAMLERRLGRDWPSLMYLLWENSGDAGLTARVRYAFMDAVTLLVERNFSWQLGDWCRARGVQYIGHVVEDAGAHARTASSLGHYFRGLAGQDMAGIDDIGGQVYPQGEDDTSMDRMGRARDAEFYHFMLGRLASSAAAIEPLKKGRAMCEIFGNYGWAEGVQLEKYLADHFMVRGVNYFVPHAFSPKAFPDPDCPPHFYAHGHNPQFRHFGALIRYMNRVCTLISCGGNSGHHVSEAAILYHAESEWSGAVRMPCEKPARVLEENQIGFDFIPSDVFAKPEAFKANGSSGQGGWDKTLRVNTQVYKALIIPRAQFITKAAALAAASLHQAGFPVIFLESLPEGLCDAEDGLPEVLKTCPVLPLRGLADTLRAKGIGEVRAAPASNYLRVLHTIGGVESYLLVNEAAQTYSGVVIVPSSGPCYAYNAWLNRLETIESEPVPDGTRLRVIVEPRKSLIVVFDEYAGQAETLEVPAPREFLHTPVREAGGVEVPVINWKRALCESIDYPAFGPAVPVSLPDTLAEEQPEFSGFARYTAEFETASADSLCLVISDAAEGVEVFVNGISAGIQIVPPYRYDISSLSKPGKNELVIEVATTLERKCYPLLEPARRMMAPEPEAASGLTGTVKLIQINKK
ncbi:MAG: hypothetical protein LBS62_09205 [Clostridiales bacterium]|jgi:hypothetical protein|nr:hypothetical protein [Clostridiales bacterium]